MARQAEEVPVADRLPGPAPEICTCSALRQATRHVTRLYDQALRPAGLSLNQYSILAKLERSGPVAIQDLAALLVMDRSTAGHLLRPLVKRGLVTIDAPGDDRRSRVVALTAAGKQLIERARPLWAGAERRFGEAFGPDAALGLRAILRQVALTGLVASGGR